MVPLFLKSLEYSLCLLSLIWDNLYSLAFDDGYFTPCPLPKLLWLSWTTLFCLSRSNSCWCISPGRLDIHHCISSGRSLGLPRCIPTDAVCGWSAPTISSALETSCFSWSCCISCKDIFLTRSTSFPSVTLFYFMWLPRGSKYL